LWNTKQKWTLFTTIFHFGLVWQLLKMIWHDATDEEFYELFEQQRPILLPLIMEMTNTQKIIPGMDQIIKELADRGYNLHILSNIGPRRFKQLKEDFPPIISQFSQAKIVQPDGPQKKKKKPDPQFFHDYLHEYKQENQNIIFIDDNKKNIAIARSLDITAIQFKSAKQLRKQLAQLGIF